MIRQPKGPVIRVLVSALGLTLLAAAVPDRAQAQEIEGTWESRYRADNRWGRSVYLSLEARRPGRGRSQNGFTLAAEQFSGATESQLSGTAADLSFRLVRQAGTFTFVGSVRDGRGRGSFSFEVDRDYVRRMAALGYPALSDERVYQFALHNVTAETVRELQALGYERLSETELSNFAIHGVSPQFIREMNELGYSEIAPDTLVELRIHGVSSDWVRRVRSALGS